MEIHGHIQDGSVVLPEKLSLPNGTPVAVFVHAPAESATNTESRLKRLREAFHRIAALPLEGNTDPFSGADHDKLLYGKP